jgi:DNA-binding transcriptional regulator YiaG
MREQFFKGAAFWADTAPLPVSEPTSLARSLGRRGVSKRIDRGHRVLSREGRRSCDRMAAFRRKVALSQGQFAQLFTTSGRTVRHWERRKFTPTPHQQWFLGILVRYAKQNGLTAFRRRFVGEPARFARPGRLPNGAGDTALR